MSSDATLAIQATGLSKCYALFEQPSDRLRQMIIGAWARLTRRPPPRLYREFWSLKNVNLQVRRGEVVGIIGKNGAGKSTLLQLLCGTLQPTSGQLNVRGRIAALLELGSGFNPEFTGRENITMSASILGLNADEVRQRTPGIIAFADIGTFIDQPVKTYSSGMYVRLAFAVATSIDPDILIIDEALSVGDGAFARRSFDRIMDLKNAGATILFCSHSMYHIQALCSQAIWLETGQVRMQGDAATVTSAYELALVTDTLPPHTDTPQNTAPTATQQPPGAPDPTSHATRHMPSAPAGTARLTHITGTANGHQGQELAIQSKHTDLHIHIHFASDPALPTPSVAIAIVQPNGSIVASAGSANDNAPLHRDPQGHGHASLHLPQLALLQGDYTINAFLACEKGIHIYDHALHALQLRVMQTGLEQGIVSLPHTWQAHPPSPH